VGIVFIRSSLFFDLLPGFEKVRQHRIEQILSKSGRPGKIDGRLKPSKIVAWS
jgi:hypothetical protein